MKKYSILYLYLIDILIGLFAIGSQVLIKGPIKISFIILVMTGLALCESLVYYLLNGKSFSRVDGNKMAEISFASTGLFFALAFTLLLVAMIFC